MRNFKEENLVQEMELQELRNVDGGSIAVAAGVIVSIIIYAAGVYVGYNESK